MLLSPVPLRRPYLIAVAALAVVAAIVVPRVQSAGGSAHRAAAAVPRPDSLHYVPLERTADARVRFAAEWKALSITQRRHARALYEKWIDTIGSNGIIDVVHRAMPGCHDEGHDLGKTVFTRLRDMDRALRSCNDACNSGCMHGAVMEFLSANDRQPAPGAPAAEASPVASSPPPAASGHVHDHGGVPDSIDRMIQRNVPLICGTSAFTGMYLPGDCAHGVGHAMMFLTNYDIPKALDYCERFVTHPMRYYCASGAYMEYRSARVPAEAPVKGPLHPCAGNRYPAACFRYVFTNTVPALYKGGGTLRQLALTCEQLPRKDELGCFHGIGNAHVTRIAQGSARLGEVCQWGDRDDQTACIEGAIERLGKFSPGVAAERCQELSGWRREVCTSAASRKMYDLEKSFALYQR